MCKAALGDDPVVHPEATKSAKGCMVQAYDTPDTRWGERTRNEVHGQMMESMPLEECKNYAMGNCMFRRKIMHVCRSTISGFRSKWSSKRQVFEFF